MATPPIAGGNSDSILSSLPSLVQLFTGSGKTTSTTNSPYGKTLVGIGSTALSNSTNSAATNTLVQNIMRQAALAFAPTIGASKEAGLYNSQTLDNLSTQSQALATGQAAQAVLNYQTSQLQIASNSFAQADAADRTTTSKTASPISSLVQDAIGAYGIGKKIFNNKDSIGDFLKDPVGSIQSIGNPSPEEAIASANQYSDTSLGASNAIQASLGGSGDAVPIASGGLDSAFGAGAGVGGDAASLADSGVLAGDSLETLGIGDAGLASSVVDTGAAVDAGVLGGDSAATLGLDAGAEGIGDAGIALGAAGGAAGGIATAAEVGEGVAAGTDAAVAAGGAEAAASAADLLPAVLAWIICTEFMKQGRLPKKYWIYGARVFASYPEWGKNGYYIWAVPCVRHIRKHPYSVLSRTLCYIFNIRAEHLAAKAGCRNAKRSFLGWIFDHGLYAICWSIAVVIYPFYNKQLHLSSLDNQESR